jgi:hypothetical protein
MSLAYVILELYVLHQPHITRVLINLFTATCFGINYAKYSDYEPHDQERIPDCRKRYFSSSGIHPACQMEKAEIVGESTPGILLELKWPEPKAGQLCQYRR